MCGAPLFRAPLGGAPESRAPRGGATGAARRRGPAIVTRVQNQPLAAEAREFGALRRSRDYPDLLQRLVGISLYLISFFHRLSPVLSAFRSVVVVCCLSLSCVLFSFPPLFSSSRLPPPWGLSGAVRQRVPPKQPTVAGSLAVCFGFGRPCRLGQAGVPDSRPPGIGTSSPCLHSTPLQYYYSTTIVL